MDQADLDRVAELLEAQGRALTPPPGALGRVMARAVTVSRPRPGFGWSRPILVAATIVMLLVGLTGGAYASTPGAPLFPVQRAIDAAYLALPRAPQDAARASVEVAERRVAQAASVRLNVSADTLHAALDDSLRYFAQARAAFALLPEGQRQQGFTTLAASERAAHDRLAGVRNQPKGANDNVLSDTVLDEVTSELEHQAQHDASEGQQGPDTQERGPEPKPSPGGSNPSPGPSQGPDTQERGPEPQPSLGGSNPSPAPSQVGQLDAGETPTQHAGQQGNATETRTDMGASAGDKGSGP
jgi:hypothetical protein